MMLPTSPLSRTLVAGAVVAGFAVAAPAAGAASCSDAGAEPGTVSTERAEAAVRCLVNQERTSRGRVALKTDGKLARTAGSYSRLLVSQRFFAHEAPSGSTPTSRIRATGYLSGARRWTVGENLAWGEQELGTPAALVKAWMKSPPHRRNILEPAYREIGVGVAAGTPRSGRTANASTLSASFGLSVSGRSARR